MMNLLGIALVVAAIGAGDGAEAPPELKRVGRLDPGLPRIDPPPDLETPQSTLENFLDAADQGDWSRAALSLDLSAVPLARQAVEGPALARSLKAVMDAQVWFRWDEVPDRPDGQDDGEATTVNPGEKAERPRSRTNIKLYDLTLGDRDFEIRLERVQPIDGPPAWVFSRQTVGHIPELFRHYGPSRLEQSVPGWLKRTRVFKVALWQWAGFALLILAGLTLGALAQRAFEALVRQFDPPWARGLAEATRGPGSLTVGLWSFHELATRYLGLARPIASVLEPFYLAVMTAALVWFLRRLIALVAGRFGRVYEAFDNDEGNVRITRLTVARHALTVLVIVGGILVILARFAWFRQVGTTLLASAGVAGLVLGVAAQRVLGNLFAGFLLAVTQPVKSGDALIFEGEFGWIEEIDITYLVIRTWDLRRLIVPIAYFLDKPFENWSRRSQQLIKPVTVHADYRIDVEAFRAEVALILESCEDWDRLVPPILDVTDCSPDSIELRVLCSAKDPATAWRLHCQLRERLVAHLRNLENGRYLPRRRLERVDAEEGAARQ